MRHDPHDPGGEYFVDTAVAEAIEESGMQDMVVHPTHYTYGDREAIDYMRDMGILEEYCVGNVIKYLYRYKHKGDSRKDIEKAIMYLEILKGEL